MKVIIELNEMTIETIDNNPDEITITIKEHNYFGNVKINDLRLALTKIVTKC